MLKLEECENEFCIIYISTPFISFHMIMKGVCLRLQLMWFGIVPLLFSTFFSPLKRLQNHASHQDENATAIAKFAKSYISMC